MRMGILLLCLVISMQALIGTVAVGGRPPAMYVFGSSILDIGNNNYLLGPAVDRANHPYNGVDFPGSIPTGRFSNGYNIADYVGPCFVSQILNVFICVKMHMDSMLKFIGPSWACIVCSGAAAKNMGFACSPPAYLSLAPATSSGGPLVQAALTNGVNYASGGAGILDSTVSK